MCVLVCVRWSNLFIFRWHFCSLVYFYFLGGGVCFLLGIMTTLLDGLIKYKQDCAEQTRYCTWKTWKYIFPNNWDYLSFLGKLNFSWYWQVNLAWKCLFPRIATWLLVKQVTPIITSRGRIWFYQESVNAWFRITKKNMTRAGTEGNMLYSWGQGLEKDQLSQRALVCNGLQAFSPSLIKWWCTLTALVL